MNELISETYPIARKEYSCMACEWLWADEWWRTAGELSISDFREIIKARNEGEKILRGEKYLCQTVKQDGCILTFRAKIAIDKICHKYGIYSDY